MRFIQTAIATFALIVATSLAADETAPDAPPQNPIGKLVELARKNMMSTVETANQRIGYCMDLEKSTIIKPGPLAKLKLTSGEIKIALSYLRIKAEDACMSVAINAATTEIIMFKTIELEAYERNDPEPFANSKDQYTAAEICCGSAEIFLNAQLNYLSLSADKRAALEAIPELKKPFNAFVLSDHFNPTPRSKP